MSDEYTKYLKATVIAQCEQAVENRFLLSLSDEDRKQYVQSEVDRHGLLAAFTRALAETDEYRVALESRQIAEAIGRVLANACYWRKVRQRFNARDVPTWVGDGDQE